MYMKEKTAQEESFIERLDRLLNEKGFQKKDLSLAIGISQSGLSTWRVSGTIPRADIAIAIARFLNVSVEYLVLGELPKLDKQTESLPYRIAKLPPKKKAIIEAVCNAIEPL